MPSRIDEAGHTKAFDYLVAEHWGKPKCFFFLLVSLEIPALSFQEFLDPPTVSVRLQILSNCLY